MSWIGINSCVLTVVYLSILQHKLVFLLPDDSFTVSYSVSVIKLDKANWLQTYFYCESENFNIIINDKLHLKFQSIIAQSYVSAWFLIISKWRKCYVLYTLGRHSVCPSVCDLISPTEPSVGLSWIFLWHSLKKSCLTLRTYKIHRPIF